MKRYTAFLAATIMTFAGGAHLPAQLCENAAVTASAASYDLTSGDYQCNELSDGTIAIVGYTGSDSKLVIPSTIEGRTVTCIGSSAFELNRSLRSVTIPDTVTTLENHAFFCCTALETISIPDSVTSISNSCFWGCSKLKKAVVPDSVGFFSSLVFSECGSLTSCKLPAGLTEIPGYTFYDCSSLKRVEIPEGVHYIAHNAFTGCTSLGYLVIPENAEIDDYAVGFSASEGDGSTVYTLIPDFTMYVYAGSPAEEYAKRFGVAYDYVENAPQTNFSLGDVNGDMTVDSADILLIASQVKGFKTMDDDDRARADLNDDGIIDTADISIIAAIVKGL